MLRRTRMFMDSIDSTMCTECILLLTKYDSRNTETSIFLKRKSFFFHGVVLVKTFVSITNVGLILTKLRGLLFSGYGQTETISESLYGNRSAQKNSTRSSKLGVNCRSQKDFPVLHLVNLI